MALLNTKAWKLSVTLKRLVPSAVETSNVGMKPLDRREQKMERKKLIGKK